MKIRITRKHIEQASPGHQKCPIAQWGHENGYPHCSVGSDDFIPDFNHEDELRIKLPRIAVRFISRYDNKKPVRPFTFTLPIKKKGGK